MVITTMTFASMRTDSAKVEIHTISGFVGEARQAFTPTA
jgi:hypothetical protein